MWENHIQHILQAIDTLDGVTTEVYLPEIANEVPTLRVTWEQGESNASYAEVRERLKLGHPSIHIWPHDEDMQITTWMMEPGQERIVAARIKQVLKDAT